MGVGGRIRSRSCRASPAYSKRCHGRLAISVRTKGPSPGGTLLGSDEIGKRLVSVPVEDLFDRSGERLAPRKQVIEDAADRVEIGRRAIVRRGAADLFGRHPTRRSRSRAHHRRRAFLPIEPMIDRIAHQRRKSEIENEDAWDAARSGEIEHQVGGLEIAVNDPARVRVGEPGQNLVDERPEDGKRPGPGNRAELEPREERAPRGDVHHQEGRSVGQDAEVAGPDDGRVVEGGEAARLLLKPPHVLGIGLGVGPVQAFERHRVAAVRIPAKVDDSHAPAAELAPDLVPAGQQVPAPKGGRDWAVDMGSRESSAGVLPLPC